MLHQFGSMTIVNPTERDQGQEFENICMNLFLV